MNNLERKMVDVLKDLKENHHVVGIKAEFEAEGTRLEEALRLKEVTTRAGLDLTIKIGGCEAMKDMYDARSIGVSRIVAPMIESAYSLKKYLGAAKMVFPKEEIANICFLINMETRVSVDNFDEMLALENISELDGIVLGRVDMTGSFDMKRDEINSDKIFDVAKELFVKAKKIGKECVIGGGVAKESLPFFNRLPPGLLDHYETRKVLFKCPEALQENAPAGILKAVGFELMWLKNKRNFYGAIYTEDEQRIVMLESRYKKLIEESGGKYE